jgi:hypothetical protein
MKAARAAGRKPAARLTPLLEGGNNPPGAPLTELEKYETHLAKVRDREAIGIHAGNGLVLKRTTKLTPTLKAPDQLTYEENQRAKRAKAAKCRTNNFHGNDILRLAAMIQYPK